MDLGDNNEETQQEKVCAPLVMSAPGMGLGSHLGFPLAVCVVQGLTLVPAAAGRKAAVSVLHGKTKGACPGGRW